MNEVDARQELVDRLREVYSHGGARTKGARDLRKRAKRGSLAGMSAEERRLHRNRLARERRAAARVGRPAKRRGRKPSALPKRPARRGARQLAVGAMRWVDFVQAYRSSNPGISYKEALRLAAPEWRAMSPEQKMDFAGYGLSGGARKRGPRLPICAPSRGVCQPAGLAAWNDFLKRWFAYYDVHGPDADWDGKEWSELSRKEKLEWARDDYKNQGGLPAAFPRGSGMSGGRRGRRKIVRKARAPRRRRGGVLVGEIGLNRGGVLVDHFYDRGGAAGGVLIDQAYN